MILIVWFKRFSQRISEALGDPLRGSAEALSRLDPNKIYLENVRSVLGVSTRAAASLCETAVRQGLFSRAVEAVCPDGAVAATADRIENLPAVLHCWVEVDGQFEESEIPLASARTIVFYRLRQLA